MQPIPISTNGSAGSDAVAADGVDLALEAGAKVTAGKPSQSPSYAVTWRETGGPVRAGQLMLGSQDLRLEGGTARSRISSRRILYSDVSAIETARRPVERIGGRPTIVLKRGGHALLAIACVDGPGCLHELAERLSQAITGTVPA